MLEDFATPEEVAALKQRGEELVRRRLHGSPPTATSIAA